MRRLRIANCRFSFAATASFVVALALSIVAAPSATARPAGKAYRIGFISAGALSTNRHLLDAFRQGLREVGYVEGQNITVEDRWADGRSERFPALLDELKKNPQQKPKLPPYPNYHNGSAASGNK